MVDGQTYTPKVAEPTATEILEMKVLDMKELLAVKLFQGDETTKSGSTFLGFSTKVHNIQQVVSAYKCLKYRFMEATHIMCAYRIMDPDVIHNTDCVDGGEFGAGRRLLQMLIDENCENVAVFVVRHHRGPNIGQIRFNMIIDTAKSAVNNMPSRMSTLLQNDGLNTNYSQFMHRAVTMTVRPIGQTTGPRLPAPIQGRTHPSHSHGTVAAASKHAEAPTRSSSATKAPLTSVQV